MGTVSQFAEFKEIPENESEYVELLSRHNAILGELARPVQKVVLVTTGYSETPEPSRTDPQLTSLDPGAIWWQTIAMHGVEETFTDPTYWHLFASEREWWPGELDPLVRLVANDVIANVLIASPDCRWVLHPYDGGMDVICDSNEKQRLLRARHTEWLSSHASGL